MKVDQKSIVRWISKRVAKRAERSPMPALRELDLVQLRHVSGGTGETGLPYKGW